MVTCPAKNDGYSGNCEFCNDRIDCMLRDILQKLNTLENAIMQMKAKSAVQ